MRNSSKRQSYETAHLGTILKDSLQTIFAIRSFRIGSPCGFFDNSEKDTRSSLAYSLLLHSLQKWLWLHSRALLSKKRHNQNNLINITTCIICSLENKDKFKSGETCFIRGTVSKHCKWQLYFLVRWVISLPSVWRSSVTRSWSPVTITWSIAIAGSWSENIFEQMILEISQ